MKKGLPLLAYHRVRLPHTAFKTSPSLTITISGLFHAPNEYAFSLIFKTSSRFIRRTMATPMDMGCRHTPHQVYLYNHTLPELEADNEAYNTDNVPPPTYQPPEGGSKVNPHQDYAVPPPGPPPVGAPSSSDQENQVAERPVRPAKARWMNRVNPFK